MMRLSRRILRWENREVGREEEGTERSEEIISLNRGWF